MHQKMANLGCQMIDASKWEKGTFIQSKTLLAWHLSFWSLKNKKFKYKYAVLISTLSRYKWDKCI